MTSSQATVKPCVTVRDRRERPMIIMSRICFITCMSWVRILVWSCRGGRGDFGLGSDFEEASEPEYFNRVFFSFISIDTVRKNWATNQTNVHPININICQVLYFSPQCNSGLRNRYPIESTPAISFRRTGSHARMEFHGSKYLKITNENDESASLLCLLFFVSYTACFFFFLPYTWQPHRGVTGTTT